MPNAVSEVTDRHRPVALAFHRAKQQHHAKDTRLQFQDISFREDVEDPLGALDRVRRRSVAVSWDRQHVPPLRAALGMGIDAVDSDRVDRMVATVSEWKT